MTIDVRKLSEPFDPAAVHWRVQGQAYPRNGAHYAMALAYIDARDVMDRLDDVCGPENWQNRYTETAKGRVLCEIGVLVGDAWVWKSDGAGNTAVEGEKGGISDALKRAAVLWGIGRYLYRLDSPWVRCKVREKNGKTYWAEWDEDPWLKVKVTQYQEPEAPKVVFVTPEQATTLADLAKKSGSDIVKTLRAKGLKGDTWADLPADMYEAAFNGMTAKIAKMDAEHDNAIKETDT